MAMVGHQTESIYRRYAIVDETMHREAAALINEWTIEQRGKARSRRDRSRGSERAKRARLPPVDCLARQVTEVAGALNPARTCSRRRRRRPDRRPWARTVGRTTGTTPHQSARRIQVWCARDARACRAFP